jgi:hypothetical protein
MLARQVQVIDTKNPEKNVSKLLLLNIFLPVFIAICPSNLK